MKNLHLLFLSLTLLIMPILCPKAEVALDEDYDSEDTNPIFYATPQETRSFSYEEFDQELKMIESVEKISPTMAESDTISTVQASPKINMPNVSNINLDNKPRRIRSR